MESFAEIKRSMFLDQTNEVSKADLPQPWIMIVDDDLDIIETLTALLQSRYRIVSCLDFEEAKQKLTPDIKLVLLDIKMASRDGIEVFNLMKAERPDLPIIFHSAYPGSSERAAAVEQMSHAGFLTKGEYDLSELFTMIRRTLKQAEGPGDACVA